jgi:hypothetical protein
MDSQPTKALLVFDHCAYVWPVAEAVAAHHGGLESCSTVLCHVANALMQIRVGSAKVIGRNPFVLIDVFIV